MPAPLLPDHRRVSRRHALHHDFAGALGRDGLLYRACGRTHNKHQTPHVAIIVYSITTLAIGLAAGIGWGPINAFGNLGYLSSLGILPIFILTNIAPPTFMLKRYRDEFSVLVHLVFPTLSSLTFLGAIYLNLHPWPKSPLNVMPWIILAVIAAAIVWVSILGRGGSDTLDRLGNVLFMAPTAEDTAASAPSSGTAVPTQARPGLGGASAPRWQPPGGAADDAPSGFVTLWKQIWHAMERERHEQAGRTVRADQRRCLGHRARHRRGLS